MTMVANSERQQANAIAIFARSGRTFRIGTRGESYHPESNWSRFFAIISAPPPGRRANIDVPLSASTVFPICSSMNFLFLLALRKASSWRRFFASSRKIRTMVADPSLETDSKDR